MNDRVDGPLTYTHPDMPRDLALAAGRARRVLPARRRAQVTSGMIAALATLAPVVLSVRGTRRR